MTSGRDEVARPEVADPAGDESLADALEAVARQLREKSAETLAPWNITPAHLRALRTLSRHGTMRLSELSERLQIAPRTATEVVDALQSRDLVRRRADPGDRRATLVEVTEHGAEILAEIRAARGTEAGRVFGRLGAADRAELARILGQLRDKPPGAGQRLADTAARIAQQTARQRRKTVRRPWDPRRSRRERCAGTGWHRVRAAGC